MRMIETDITYGTILKIEWLNEIETVMLISDITGNTSYPCKVFDLSSKELIDDYLGIEDFKSKAKILEVVGQLDSLLQI